MSTAAYLQPNRIGVQKLTAVRNRQAIRIATGKWQTAPGA
jgi:hypothetical protein